MNLLRSLFAFLLAAVFIGGLLLFTAGCQNMKDFAGDHPEAVSEIADSAVKIGATVVELIRMRGEPESVVTIAARSDLEVDTRRYVYEDMVYITRDGKVVDKFPTVRGNT